MTVNKITIASFVVVALLVGWVGGEGVAQQASAAQTYATQTQLVSLQKQVSLLERENLTLNTFALATKSRLTNLESAVNGLLTQSNQSSSLASRLRAAELAINCIEQAGFNSNPYGFHGCGI